MSASIEVTLLGPGEAHLLDRVAPDVFDHEIVPANAAAFLAEPHCHLAVAIDDGVVVGFASALDYLGPDKPRELWIDEVGVAPSHHRRGLGKRLLAALFEAGRARGCVTAWVLTEPGNVEANGLYRAAGGEAMEDGVVGYAWPLQD